MVCIPPGRQANSPDAVCRPPPIAMTWIFADLSAAGGSMAAKDRMSCVCSRVFGVPSSGDSRGFT